MVRTGYQYYGHLEEELGRSIGLRRYGGLLVIENENQYTLMQERCSKLNEVGIAAEMLSATQAAEVEPLLDPSSMSGALYYPDEAQVYPFALMWALINRARESGLDIHNDTEVTGFDVTGGRIKGVHTHRGTISAPVVVLTTGAGTAGLGRMLGRSWDIFYDHGEAYVTEPANFWLNCHLDSASFFEDSQPEDEEEPGPITVLATTQSMHGHFLLGETMHQGEGFDPRPSAGSGGSISAMITRFLPDLRNLRVLRGWAAPVAFTNDGLPYFGPVGGIEGLILATAFRSTVVITPLAGETVMQLVTRGYSDLDISHFSPDRVVV